MRVNDMTQDDKYEALKKVASSAFVAFIVSGVLTFTSLFFTADMSSSIVSATFVNATLQGFLVVMYFFTKTSDPEVLETHTKLFRSTRNLVRVFTVLVVSMFASYFAMVSMKSGLGYSNDYYEIDELSMVFSVTGIFFGFANTFYSVFLDRLYIEPKRSPIAIQSEPPNFFGVVVKRTVITFFLNFILFIFAVICVKVYNFFLLGFGLELSVRVLPFDLQDLVRYVFVIIAFSFSCRFSYKILSQNLVLDK
ncbi:hypothetical protein EIN_282020 [Entamoeba invadens IP1]|uniref:Uncharacterized protein n=1 Tax=Entamoeba invadens IP1 TaxID=370355 RepID=A0A0A1U032_ENTIV|nr:hypothetical protein EIN_282020 [Entamoeba invadens IP1]ELP85831.1 hypothetical protein EIN_282020 [Entamoeba invadens IP1]|eukprot:XP_004185177.1 hypothetical protein EIN_282020 [Entamoeba invadens IP1]